MICTNQNDSTNDDCVIGDDVDFISTLRKIRLKYHKNVVIGHLNVNKIEHKFDSLKLIIPNHIDIMVLGECKLNDSYPTTQFLLDGFSPPHRLDRNENGGGILIYIREDIPGVVLNKYKLPSDIEGIFIELNFRKSKWLLFGTYHPPSQSDNYYFDQVGKALSFYNTTYDKILIAGDLNAEITEPCLSNFMDAYGLKCIVHENTCFKSTDNPSMIDLFLTNSNRSFQSTCAISTGISDFHKMIVTVMKTTCEKLEPKVIQYRNYKNINNDNFRHDLLAILRLDTVHSSIDFKTFQNIFLEVLEKHAPLKRKTIRANEVPYMTKQLRKAFMTRSRLENKYYSNSTHENRLLYKKHKNFCNRLRYRERKKFYENMDDKKIVDCREFWKTTKPFLSNKAKSQCKITLIKEDKIISDDNEVACTLNNFFEKAVSSLDIVEPIQHLNDCSEIEDPIDAIIAKFSNHPSIKNIKQHVKITSSFKFRKAQLSEIEDEIDKLNPKKSNPSNSVKAKDIQTYKDICKTVLHNIINRGIEDSYFDDGMKIADLTPVFKKLDRTDETKYRPISGLPAGSKIFERVIENQMIPFVQKFLSSFLCGYRKGYSTQHALTLLLERWKRILDRRGFGGAVLMDLSKAFDTLNHELLIAKLHAYGFEKSALKLIMSYLSNRWQRTRINNSFSSWSELSSGVPQGSILGNLLFNIYLNDLFFLDINCDICNFADDTTPYTCDMCLKTVLDRLEHTSSQLIEWFDINYMKLNADKCHLIVCGHKQETVVVNVGGEVIKESSSEQLLGIDIKNNLSSNTYVNYICKKAGKKLNALSRLCKILSFSKRRQCVKAYFESQFAYCPLVWIFHSRVLNAKINLLHYRALQIIYRDYDSQFDELLAKDNSVKIHHRNIHTLAFEMFKVTNGLSPDFMNDIFYIKQRGDSVSSNTRKGGLFYNNHNPRTTGFDLETLSNICPKIWEILPKSIKACKSLNEFICSVKKWTPTNCPCRLCRTYVPALGFID